MLFWSRYETVGGRRPNSVMRSNSELSERLSIFIPHRDDQQASSKDFTLRLPHSSLFWFCTNKCHGEIFGPRLAQLWIVLRCTTTTPAFRWTSVDSSSCMSISPEGLRQNCPEPADDPFPSASSKPRCHDRRGTSGRHFAKE